MMTVSKHRHLCLGFWVCGAVGASSGGPTGPATPKLDKYKTNDISTWTESGVWRFGAAACFLMFYFCIFQETLRLKSLLPSWLSGRGCGGRGERILNMQTVLILIKKFRYFPQLRARQNRFIPEWWARSEEWPHQTPSSRSSCTRLLTMPVITQPRHGSMCWLVINKWQVCRKFCTVFAINK